MVGIDGMLLKQAFGPQKWWFLQVLGELLCVCLGVVNFAQWRRVKVARKEKENKRNRGEKWETREIRGKREINEMWGK